MGGVQLGLTLTVVGGRTLELAIAHIKKFGRIVINGDTSGYNTSTPRGIEVSTCLLLFTCNH